MSTKHGPVFDSPFWAPKATAADLAAIAKQGGCACTKCKKQRTKK
jgi:hypothetical protein